MTWRRSTTERTFATQTQYQGVLQEIKAFFDDCSAEGADFPWTVASFAWDTPSANKGYVVLKRKDASAGRIYIAATAAADQNTTNYLPMSSTSASLSAGYDRTATVDSPTTAPTAGAPFGGTFQTNWMGAHHLQATLTPTAYRLRAYTHATANAIVLQITYTDNSQSLYILGNLCANLHTGLPQIAQLVCREMVNGVACVSDSTGTLSDGIMQPRVAQATSNSNVATGSRACTWDATNGWQRLYRITSINWDAQNTLTVSTYNTIFAQTNGDRFFLPIYCVGHNNNAAVLQKMFRLKNLGIGEIRSRLTSQLVDNSAQPRGWYLGYHQTVTSDACGISLLNNDFA